MYTVTLHVLKKEEVTLHVTAETKQVGKTIHKGLFQSLSSIIG